MNNALRWSACLILPPVDFFLAPVFIFNRQRDQAVCSNYSLHCHICGEQHRLPSVAKVLKLTCCWLYDIRAGNMFLTPSRAADQEFPQEPQTFSTKKARPTPLLRVPRTPRPPVKNSLSASRYNRVPVVNHAQAISFRDNSDTSFISSKLYDQNSKTSYLKQCFDVIELIGSGSFGEVYKVKSREDGKFYAVKKSRDKFRGHIDRDQKLEEVKKFEQLPRHQNCVHFYRAWEERQNLYMQFELCETSLSNYAENNHDVPETVVWYFFVDLLQGIKHLHDHNLIHLDIKPDNIFISHDGICKLGDFGLVVEVNKGDLSDALEGDPKYLAPELMKSQFSKAADIFSLGMTILELATDLDVPQGGDLWHRLRSGKLPEEFSEKMSTELYHIIEWMLQPDISVRATVDGILELPVLQKYVRWRRFKNMQNNLIHKTKAMFLRITVWLVVLFSFFIRFFKKSSHTDQEAKKFESPEPNLSRSRLDDWDLSYSDEDVFDDPNKSRSNSNLSSSESSAYLDQSAGVTSVNVINSTPHSMRRRDPVNPSRWLKISPRKLLFDSEISEIARPDDLPPKLIPPYPKGKNLTHLFDANGATK